MFPTPPEGQNLWRYATTAPNEGWQKSDLDDSNWQHASAGFRSGSPIENLPVGNDWPGNQIWLRRTFNLSDTNFVNPQLLVYSNRAKFALYLSGRPVATPPGIDSGLLKTGRKSLALHRTGKRSYGHFIDVHLVNLEGRPHR